MNNKTILSNGCADQWPHEVIAYTDGASRGNPGQASFGLIVMDKKEKKVFEEAQVLGVSTNNVAEYRGVHRVLELAVQNQVQELILKTDSQLVVKQLQGLYKIKSPGLKPIYAQCMALAKKLPQVQWIHVLRENNTRADELANLALDALEVL